MRGALSNLLLEDEIDPEYELRELQDSLRRYNPDKRRMDPQTYPNWKQNVGPYLNEPSGANLMWQGGRNPSSVRMDIEGDSYPETYTSSDPRAQEYHDYYKAAEEEKKRRRAALMSQLQK